MTRVAIWTYAILIRLLPARVCRDDGQEMLETLKLVLANSSHPARDAWRALTRFPAVLVLEWKDALFARTPTPPISPRAGTMDAITRMIRQGGRSLLRTPAFSASVVLLIGLGVGSVSAMFAVVDNVLLRRMPYPSAERLVVIENGSHSVPAMMDMRAMTSIEAWGAATTEEANLTGEGDPLRVRRSVVSDGFFPMFGARAHLGRLFGASDFETGQGAVLSYGAWVRVFGADSNVVGRTIRVNDRPLTVVGVLDGNFVVPEVIADATTDVWTPLETSAPYVNDRNYWAFSVAGRLRPSATVAQATQEAERVAAERARLFPQFYSDNTIPSSLPVTLLHEATTGDVQQPLTVLLAAVTVLMLIACANVTHLFLTRAVVRTREMAVRRALGANTRSLVVQLLIESLMLGTAGAITGIVLANGGVRVFLALMPRGLPRATEIAVDTRVLVFAAGAGVVTAIVFGLLPALRFTGARMVSPLRSSSRSVTDSRAAHTVRSALVVAEVALSLVLVAQAGWLIRSFMRMNNQALGFETANIVTMPMSVTGIDTQGEWNTRMQAMRESLMRTSGVEQVAFGLTMPLEWAGGGRCCWGLRPQFAGKTPLQRPSMFHPVTENYFALFEIPLMSGGGWTQATARANPVPAVINQALAAEVFGGAPAALGATFTANGLNLIVTGVAANNRHYGADREYGTAVYLPVEAIPYSPGRVHMAVKTARVDDRLPADLRAAVWSAEPNLPVPTIRPIEEWARAASARRRFDSALFGTFSTIALILVAGGLAGTLFYMVSLQRRNLGIRLALGATPRGVERTVLTNGVGMAAIGVLLGSAGAWVSGRFIESRLFGVQARDLGTLAIGVAVIMVIALAASWLPARRAALTDPNESLRAE